MPVKNAIEFDHDEGRGRGRFTRKLKRGIRSWQLCGLRPGSDLILEQEDVLYSSCRGYKEGAKSRDKARGEFYAEGGGITMTLTLAFAFWFFFLAFLFVFLVGTTTF